MIIKSTIEVGWFPGMLPRHNSWPDISLNIQACYWFFDKPMAENDVGELRDYLRDLSPVIADHFFEYHGGNKLWTYGFS